MSPTSFDYIRTWLCERTGIALNDTKHYLVETRLAPLLQQLGLDSIDEFVERWQAGPNGALERAIITALATHETSFFRDIAVFDGIRQTLLPDLISRRTAQRRLDIWCAGCSSGQEAYSMAILLSEHFPHLAGWTVRLLASDLSSDMIDRARAGRFTQLEVNRGLPAKYLVKYFRQVGDDWHIHERLRRMIEFRAINLTSIWPVLGGMDLVLLRNVLVYFDVTTKQAIFRRLHPVLRSDGYLVLGSTESVLQIDGRFERTPLTSASVYRKKAA